MDSSRTTFDFSRTVTTSCRFIWSAPTRPRASSATGAPRVTEKRPSGVRDSWPAALSWSGRSVARPTGEILARRLLRRRATPSTEVPHDPLPPLSRREVDNQSPAPLSVRSISPSLDRSTPMTCCYAIVPDGSDEPAALFEELEDAMDWGLRRYGGDA